MVNIGILSAAKSSIYDFLRSYLIAAGRFDVVLTALTPKSDFRAEDLFVLEKTAPELSLLLSGKSGQTVITDHDNAQILPALAPLELCVITCGFSQKATATASSIGESGFTYCLQRSIFTLDGNEIFPQEFSVRCKGKQPSLSACLMGTTALLLCGESGEKIRDFMF